MGEDNKKVPYDWSFRRLVISYMFSRESISSFLPDAAMPTQAGNKEEEHL